MLNFLAFLAAVSASVGFLELASLLFRRDKLTEAQQRLGAGVQVKDESQANTRVYRHNILEAFVLTIWPARFDPDRAADKESVETLLRRSGYYYATVGEFYAAALRDFVMFLIVAVFLASLMFMMKMTAIGLLMAALLIYNGLRWPYARLKSMARQRADSVQNNMMVAMTIMESMAAAGRGALEGAKSAQNIGGPFCAVLAVYIKNLTRFSGDPTRAMEEAKTFMPDPGNLDAILFLDAIRDDEKGTRGRFLETVHAARIEAQRRILTTSTARASKVQSRAVIYGFMASIGMIATLILPYVVSFSMGF